MTTETVRLRMSPSGKFIGDPPVRVGAGSNGVIARAHGSGSPMTIAVTTPVSVPGLDAISVDLQPGYLYELDLSSEILVEGLTQTGVFVTYYRLHTAGGSWGPAIACDAPQHTIPLTTGTVATNQAAYNDVTFGISVTTPVDMVCVCVAGINYNLDKVHVLPSGCSARITEYQS